MQFVQLDDVTLEYDEVGSGDPLLLIHGGLIDTFFPDPAELSVANSHRVISYHRRGYGGSSRATAPFTISDQAADARALLQHLGVSCAHLAGHSYASPSHRQWRKFLALSSPNTHSQKSRHDFRQKRQRFLGPSLGD